MGASPSREQAGACGAAVHTAPSAGYGSFTNLPPFQFKQRQQQQYQKPYEAASSSSSEEDASYIAAYQYYASQGFVSGHPQRGKWHTGLCDCVSDIPTCMLGCFCPCVAFGRNVEVLDGGQTACIAASLLWCILQQLCLCGCIYSCWYRRKLRAMFDLPEGPCWDCCVHALCFPCAFCQESREIDIRSKSVPTVLTPPQRQRLTRTCSY